MNRLRYSYYLLIIILLTSVDNCACKNYNIDKSTQKETGIHNPSGEPRDSPFSDTIGKNLTSQLVKNKGIPNIGNSCYMNATLQSILSLFGEPLRKMKPDPIKQAEGKSDLATSAINLLNAVTNPSTDSNEKVRSNVEAFFKNLSESKADGGLGWQDKCGTQEDASELLINFLDWLQVPKATLLYKLKADNNKERLVGKQDSFPMLSLHIPLKTPITMQDIVDDFLAPEEEVEVNWNETDKKNTKVTKIPLLASLDKLYQGMLILDLKRYRNDLTKIETTISNPFKFTIKKEQTLDLTSDRSYQLISFIQHIGSHSGGHYIAYVKVGNQWVRYDDATVSTVSDKEAEQAASNMYTGFYMPANRQKAR